MTDSPERRNLAAMSPRGFCDVFRSQSVGALLLTASTFFSPAYGQNLVVNGSFDPYEFVTGWQVTGGFVGNTNPGERDSGFYIGISVSQTLNTISGQRYLLSFTAMGDQWGQSFRMATMQASWSGRLIASYTSPNDGVKYRPRFLVTATNTSTVLGFASAVFPEHPGLDDVSVIPAPATQPEIVLNSPANGATYTMGDNIALRSEVTPGAGGRSIRQVDYYYNGINLIASVSNAPYSTTWSNVPPGTWYLSARVSDSVNEMTTAFAARINVATRPIVEWASPELDAVVATRDNVPLSARVLYNTGTSNITRLVFRAGSNIVHEFRGTITNGLHTATWTNVPEGEFTVSATGYDAGGNILSAAESRLFVLPPAVLDQSQFYFTSTVFTSPTALYAQTFTPSINGELHHIEVSVFPAHFLETFPISVTVVEAVNGQPIGRVLAQTTIQESSCCSAFFRSNRPVLRAGQLYAFVISAPLQTLGLVIRTSWEGNQYRQGSMWRKLGDEPWEEAERYVNPNADMVFATYMIPRNVAPIANAGLDRIYECDDRGTPIELGGSASSDPDGDALTFRWSLNALLISTGATARVAVPLGTNEFTLVVTDPGGLTSTDSVQIIVRDTVPPHFRSATATPAILWPPNHQMAPVQLALDVSDGCDSDLRFQIVSVTSNEPGSDDNDWEITGPLSLRLRAERAGPGDRAYTVTVAATDLSGNSSQHDVQVTVPINRAASKGPKPRLTRHANGAVGLDFETGPGQVYRIESSVDLIYWTPITPWLTATEGQTSCLDQDAVAAPRRFYRVVLQE